MEKTINKTTAIKALYSSTFKVARGDGRVTWKDGHETTAEETAAIDAKYLELLCSYIKTYVIICNLQEDINNDIYRGPPSIRDFFVVRVIVRLIRKQIPKK